MEYSEYCNAKEISDTERFQQIMTNGRNQHNRNMALLGGNVMPLVRFCDAQYFPVLRDQVLK